MVDIKSSEKIGIPLILNGEIIPNTEKLERLCEYLNFSLKNLKTKIKRLEENLKKGLG
jgi:tRNA(Phe) wybutosine-synthesizing methylase Tyw3